jgi:outer membrane protein assembly factor BamB
MKQPNPRVLLCLLAAIVSPACAETLAGFQDLAGWWSAEPVHGGESSRLALHFLEKDGKPQATLSVVAIGAYDIGLGEVTLAGNSIDTRPLSFPLTWNPQTRTLTGHLPAELAPVYDIPVEFRRSEPLGKPPAQDWAAPRPELLWSVATGAAVWAGLELDADGSAVFAGNDRGELHAIGVDGRLRWKFETGAAIRAQPRVMGRHLYVTSDSGFLFKLDRRSGVEAWRARIDAGSEARIPTNQPKTRWDRYGSSVVSDGRRLFVASRDRHLYALDAKTGRELWRVAAGDIMTATPALHDGNVIFADYAGKVRAVAASDGRPRWGYDARLAVPGDIVVADDRVLLGSRSYDLIALDAASGRESWKRYYWFSWIESPAVVRDGVVYTGSSDAKYICARDPRDGALRWKSMVPGWAWPRVAIDKEWLVAGTVGAGNYPGAPQGSLLALDRDTGQMRWLLRDPPGEEFIASGESWGFAAAPVVAGGTVYAADLDGKVHAIRLK